MVAAAASLLVSCSVKKNTATTRMWHAFHSRFNIYYNGEQAFIEGDKAKIEGHKDNYTDFLPVFLVGNEQSRKTGSGNYDRAITKCQKAIQLHSIQRKPKLSQGKRKSAKKKAYLQRREFNPFLKKAWMLMARSQYQKGEFLEAAATFSYISRHYKAEPAVAAEAEQWLSRCYVRQQWYYDAEEALRRAARDSIRPSRRLTRLMADTRTDLLLSQGRYSEALPLLQQTARHTKQKYLKARLYYLLGQVSHHVGRDTLAYKALRKCERLSPPFELAFHARVLQTEVLAGKPDAARKMVRKLRRMAKDVNNKDYLDQVYYAMGNIWLSLNDTTQAISAYETGREKSTRGGIEKGVLVLRLGEIYWEKRRFADAQRCYTEALALIDKSRADYAEVTRRSKVLDKLVPHTEAVHLQDSLQELARMDEPSRNAAIDRVIEALKKKEEEERKARKDSAAAARMEENGRTQDTGNRQNATSQPQTDNRQTDATWYFYNPTLVMQGKQDFQKRWGKRKNEDNWRRSNRTVVQMDSSEGYDYEAEDSLRAAADSLQQAEQTETEDKGKGKRKGKDTDVNPAEDPHYREYYLAQIPFTDEQMEASDAIITEGLYNAGIIEKDDLEDFPLAAETLERLVTAYPDFEKMPEALYELFLLYSRWGKHDHAQTIRRRMADNYPDHALTRLITAPDFEENARFGREIEDSLYAATYTAYRLRDHATVEANYKRSLDKYPSGLNRPKFMLVHTLDRLPTAPTSQLIAELRDLLQQYPESDVSPMAGMIVKGLESGRTIGSGVFDLGSLWNRRTAEADSTAAGAARQFTPDRIAPFLFVLAYPTDSIVSNSLLYEMAQYNFTTFVASNFDMSFAHSDGLSYFIISGYRNFDEAHAYAQKAMANPALANYFDKGKVLLIAQPNFELLGTTFSINDYLLFYEQHFAPLKLRELMPAETEEEEPIEQHYEDEYTPEELEKLQQPVNSPEDDGGEDDGEWYPAE